MRGNLHAAFGGRRLTTPQGDRSPTLLGRSWVQVPEGPPYTARGKRLVATHPFLHFGFGPRTGPNIDLALDLTLNSSSLARIGTLTNFRLVAVAPHINLQKALRCHISLSAQNKSPFQKKPWGYFLTNAKSASSNH